MRSMTRLLVTGAEGLLGSEVTAAAARRGYVVEGAGRADLDVTDEEAVRARLVDRSPEERHELVIHCAAYTAVDGAEEEPERASRVNRDGTAHVARAAADGGAWFIYPSTDYVFDGERATPYLPETPPAPRSVYGRTKLEGERVTLASAPEALVARTSWLYGAGGRNFVTAMLERGRAMAREDGAGPEGAAGLRVVDDQRGRPTWARNTAEGILDLFERRVRGVWHVADGGEATWLDLARETFRLCGVEVPIGPVSTAEWGAPAPRPAYSVLDVAGTEALLGRARMDWRDALRRFLTETGDIT